MENEVTTKDSRETRQLVWFSRILRWVLGGGFIAVAIIYWKEGGWPALLFGLLIFITGFFRPRRCVDECNIETGK